jgi:hypothetical protein
VVERQYLRYFSIRVAPMRDITYGVVEQFEETGRVCDKRATGRKRSASVHTEEVVVQRGRP